jgi:hypothetical protein
MRNVLIVILFSLLLSACNKESVRITGKLRGIENAKAELRLRTIAGKEKNILSDINIEDEEFDAFLENIKPPFKMTFVIDNAKEYNIWVFCYGKFSFELNSLNVVRINDSFENDELIRVNETYDKMYLKPLKEQIDWVANYESAEHDVINEADEEKLERYKIQIKKAYRLRKKSILKTVRKAPQNPIAMALFYDEFKSLTKWQKEECFKLSQKYYSDTGMNWQLKH